MTDETDTIEMIHEDALPGHESALEPKPDWEPLYPGSGRLEGKVALITGADSGIVYLCEHDDAAETRRIVEGEGRRAIVIAGDLGDKDFCDKVVEETVDK